ncbi:MAG: ATP-binding protein, partial [Oscillospiraceae bacterium]|nr:ATP-binding protein [Oscillospiraceae bacterium]
LVENAVKFSSVNRPPYHISITGEKSDEYYTLSIADNGPGFSEKELQNLAKKIAEIDVSGLLPSLEISGMGLLNVYIRYKLLHRGDIIFKLENHLPHGARVTIGERYEKL